MKKNILIIAGILSIFGVLFLATVDLKPYLGDNEAVEEVSSKSIDNVSLDNNSLSQEIVEPKVVSEIIATGTAANLDEVPVIITPIEKILSQTVEITDLVVEEMPVESKKPAQNKIVAPIDFKIENLPKQEFPFSILLDTYVDQSVAQLAVLEYQSQGVESFWVKVDLGQKGVKFRLFSKFFSTALDAQNYIKQQGLTKKFVKRTMFSSLVGVFNDLEQLAVTYHHVQQLDVAPYVLGTDNGDNFLYVGAFYTKVGAEIQCEVLAGNKIPCSAVKRSTAIQ